MQKLGWLMLAATVAFAAESRDTKKAVFSNIREVILDNVNGPIEVAGHNGANVEVEYTRITKAESDAKLDEARRAVTMEPRQDGDKLRMFVDGPWRCDCEGERRRGVHYRGWREYGYEVTYEFRLKVPAGTKLDLRTINHGEITVRDTVGHFDVRNINGGIQLTEVAGSGRADALNGSVTVVFAKNPAGESTFKSLNGTVDVSFRPGLNAEMRFKTFNGDAYTDFETTPVPIPASLETSRQGTKYVLKRDRMTAARVGTGGPVLVFDAFNGNIKIRKRER